MIKFEIYKIETIDGRAQNVILSQYMNVARARRALATMLKECSSHEYWSNNPTTYNIIIKWVDELDSHRPYKELRITPNYHDCEGVPHGYHWGVYSRPIPIWRALPNHLYRQDRYWMREHWTHMVCPRCGYILPHWAINLPHPQNANALCCCHCQSIELGRHFGSYDLRYMDQSASGQEDEPSTTAREVSESTNINQIHDMLDSYSCRFEKSKLENVSNSAKLRLGAELEAELLTLPDAHALEDCLESLRLKHDLIIKSDGSLTDGAEFVTLPLKKDELKKTLNVIIDKILDVGSWRSWNGGNCGFHIHVNRTACNISALLQFFIDYKEDIKKLSGRKNWRYCDYYIYKNNNSDSRYLALNFQNSNTVEFRLWRGSLKKSTLNAYIDFTYEVCRLGRKLKTMTFQQVIVSSQSHDLYETAKLRWCNLNQIAIDHKGKLSLLPESAQTEALESIQNEASESTQNEALESTQNEALNTESADSIFNVESVSNTYPESVSSDISRVAVAEALQAMLEANNWSY